MGLLDKVKQKFAPAPELELYGEDELDALDRYVEKAFGTYQNVLHELVSEGIHVDLLLIEPTEERPYYTVLTQGMGAHPMVVPPQMEPYHVERAEIAVALPADWKLDSDDEKDYWPLRWLKVLARMPIEQNTWLGYGHTVAGGGPLADNTQFSGVMLGYALDRTTGKPARAQLPGGREVVVYQMLPVYTEELRFKQRHNADALLDLMRGTERFEVVDINRPSYCPGS